MRYFLLAGEASGDNLGALLIEELSKLDAAASFAYFGGDAMAKASGLSPKRHIRDLAFMGFVEIVRNLPTIYRLLAEAKRALAAFAPDVLICIDYPGFNLRMAKWAKRQGIRVEFYVSPQIWAWRQSRVHRIAKVTDRILSILPFEPAFYERFGHSATYVGHPLPRRIDAAMGELEVPLRDGAPVLALLPGSRRQEIDALLPVMLGAATRLRDQHPQLRIVLAAAEPLDDVELEELASSHDITFTREAYALLAQAHLAAVASGTATLETALFGVPEVVCYRGGAVSVALARKLIKVPYISLVNLILGRLVVPELIQRDCTAETLFEQLSQLMQGEVREKQIQGFGELRAALQPYEASARAAELIYSSLKARCDEPERVK